MNACVVCGSEIPEGYQVCCTCEKNSLLNMGAVPFDDDACMIIQDDWEEK